MNGLTHSVTVDRRARLLRFGALIAAALMLLLSAFSTSAARAAESDPTIVLVHGAFASPAGWDRVAAALHKDGYQTATPALGLASVSDDVAIVRSTLDAIPGDKILVGHSYGGFVITNAASGRTDVRGLVYTAAYVPEAARRSTPEPWLQAGGVSGHLVPAPSFPFFIVDPQFFPEDFAQDLNPKLGAEIAAQQRPTSLGLFVTPSGPAAWHALPSWYAVSAHDRAIDPALQRFMAQRAGSTTVQFAAASHVGGLTHYKARFVKLIEQAIDATAT